MHVAILFALSHFFFWSSPIDWQMNQQNVVVRGIVVDEAGHAVPGVPVYATSDAFDAHTISDSKGQFIFLTLFPGTYYLEGGGTSPEYDHDIYSTALDDPNSPFYEPPQLYAGFEYGATIVLSQLQTKSR